MVYYLAYGSNLHPLRLAARVPSARVIGVIKMPGYLLAFHKRSIDGSGKCLIYQEQGAHHIMYGVLYEFDSADKANLDRLEGVGNGYIEKLVQFTLDGVVYSPYIYVAQSTHIDRALFPYHWYKNLVLAGARYHKFPSEYIASIEAIPSISDPDIRRTQENENLLKQLQYSN